MQFHKLQTLAKNFAQISRAQNKEKSIFLALLLRLHFDENTSSRGKEDITLSSIPGQKKKKCFIESELDNTRKKAMQNGYYNFKQILS